MIATSNASQTLNATPPLKYKSLFFNTKCEPRRIRRSSRQNVEKVAILQLSRASGNQCILGGQLVPETTGYFKSEKVVTLVGISPLRLKLCRDLSISNPRMSEIFRKKLKQFNHGKIYRGQNIKYVIFQEYDKYVNTNDLR